MSLGVRNYIGTINVSDSAELAAYLRINEQPVTKDQITGVVWTVQTPDGVIQPAQGGIVNADGSGYLRWTSTTEVGEYLAQAQFTLLSGEKRSVMTNFTVIDPFNPPLPTAADLLAEQVFLRLEDCFDSLEGGPWLRDRTMAHFDTRKIEAFIPEALADINVQMPPTNYSIDMFVNTHTTPASLTLNAPMLIKGLLVLAIRHLMRSYVEQPTPQGGQVVWHDRTRYTQMWTQLYQIEYQDYIAYVRLAKRTELGLGHSALLTASKAGRLLPYGSQRSRGISRGYF